MEDASRYSRIIIRSWSLNSLQLISVTLALDTTYLTVQNLCVKLQKHSSERPKVCVCVCMHALMGVPVEQILLNIDLALVSLTLSMHTRSRLHFCAHTIS